MTKIYRKANRTCKISYILNECGDYYENMIVEYQTNGKTDSIIECKTSEYIEDMIIYNWYRV